jgi:hypothetical protein
MGNLQTFEQWKARVDKAIAKRLLGMTSEELPDWDYRRAYDEGMRPVGAASHAIKHAKKELGL